MTSSASPLYPSVVGYADSLKTTLQDIDKKYPPGPSNASAVSLSGDTHSLLMYLAKGGSHLTMEDTAWFIRYSRGDIKVATVPSKFANQMGPNPSAFPTLCAAIRRCPIRVDSPNAETLLTRTFSPETRALGYFVSALSTDNSAKSKKLLSVLQDPNSSAFPKSISAIQKVCAKIATDYRLEDAIRKDPSTFANISLAAYWDDLQKTPTKSASTEYQRLVYAAASQRFDFSIDRPPSLTERLPHWDSLQGKIPDVKPPASRKSSTMEFL